MRGIYMMTLLVEMTREDYVSKRTVATYFYSYKEQDLATI